MSMKSILKKLKRWLSLFFKTTTKLRSTIDIRYSIPDFGILSDPNLMKELLEEMHLAMNERQQTVYIHCRGGIGRTGTTVGCFLKQYGNYENGDDALQELNRLFQTSGRSMESSYSPETPDQIRFVKEWNSN